MPDFRKFARRVRALRAWIGLGAGLCLGAGLSAVWAILDWTNVLYSEWYQLGILTATCGILGVLVGLLRKVTPEALAVSIDRRAHLEDRLITANERQTTDGTFDQDLREDASRKLAGVTPASIYPIRVSRWHAGALVLGLVAASLFLLGNTPLVLSKEAKKVREEEKQKASDIQHVLKPLEEQEKAGELSPAEKRLADELRRLSRDLEKARLNPEEAMRRANDIEKQGQKLAQERFEKADQALQAAESARQKMERAQQQKMDPGAGKLDPNEMPSMAQMQQTMDSVQNKLQDPSLSKAQTDALRQQMSALKQAQAEAAALQEQIKQTEQQLRDPNLTSKQRAALLAKLASLKKKLAVALKLSENVQKMLEKMVNDPLWKEIQEAAAKLVANAKANGGKGGPQHELTKEEIEDLQRRIEELAKRLQNDAEMQKFLKALLESLKHAKIGECNGACPFGLLPLQLPGAGAPTKDMFYAGTGYINKGKGEKGRGVTHETQVTGEARDMPGEDAYIELRGPTSTGMTTSIPYRKVLPTYRKKADEAIDRQQIPPEHQKRVKKYFESLGQ